MSESQEVQYEYVYEYVEGDGEGVEYETIEVDGDEQGQGAEDVKSEGEEDEDMEEDEELQWMSTVTQQTVHREPSFVVMSADELLKQQQALLCEVQETLKIPVAIAGILMRAFKWNKERVITEYVEDHDNVCKKLGINTDNPIVFQMGVPGKRVTCNICYDDVDGSNIAALRCGHWYCRDCWQQYIHVKIEEGMSCLVATCPGRKCPTALDESVVKEFADPENYRKYANFMARSFVEDNPHIKWCPAPNCGRALRAANAHKTVVKCLCGCKFCFSCGNEAHDPSNCEQVKMWKSKEQNESETSNYLALNTKDCPQCRKTIDKDGGCNHMTCRSCKYEFCWVCLGDWKEHGSQTGGYYSCNKYKPDDKKEQSKEKARRELEKYIHYYTRFANHENSRKFENVLRKKAEEKMAQLQAKNRYSSWLDVDYIQKGVEQLIECRSVLKYTYVFSYYLEEGPEKTLFEYLQQDLEKNTEALSGLLESKEEVPRDDVANTTRLAATRLKHLLDGVRNGLTS